MQCCKVFSKFPKNFIEAGLIYKETEKGAIGGLRDRKNLCPGKCELQTWVGEKGPMPPRIWNQGAGAGLWVSMLLPGRGCISLLHKS